MVPFKDPEKRREYNRTYHKKHYRKNPEYHKKRVRQRKREIRSWFDQYKQTLNCFRCGLSGKECSWMIEFHHSDPLEKRDLVTYMVANGYGRDTIMKEIEKCEPVCANCHRKIHYEEKQAGGKPFGGGLGIGKNGPEQGPSRSYEKKRRRKFRKKMAKRRASDKGGELGSD